MRILMTGASRGIGMHLSKILDEHDLTKLDRSDIDLNDTFETLYFNMDKVEMLINCAGHNQGSDKFELMDGEDIVSMLNVNLISPMLLSYKVLSKNPKAKIVNITSTNIDKPSKNSTVYTTAKTGLSCFTKALQREGYNSVEARVGLTKTSKPDSFYEGKSYMNVEEVVYELYKFIFGHDRYVEIDGK